MFIEANADITLEQFGHTLHHPFPMPVPGSRGIIHCPLLLIQVHINAKLYK